MPQLLFDAHCHVRYKQSDAVACVVNSTTPEDWAALLARPEDAPGVIQAIGLHPWKIKDAPTDWQNQFLQLLPRCSAIGEIGLDQWIEDCDIAEQKSVFRWQLEQAAERNLPVSIHCLKASEPLLRILKSSALPARGIHLHAYSGSAEQVYALVELGAYFSFHTGQLKPNAKKVRAAICKVPAERILIETDASDTLEGDEDALTLLRRGYEQIAELRGITSEQLANQAADNFKRYFLDD